MRLWGLTGGIASGKSSVSRLLVEMGRPVIDADATYHALIAPIAGRPSPLARAIADQFGDNMLDATGRVVRTALAACVFADPEQRLALEAITHPAVHEAVQKQQRALAQKGHALAFYDVPLLFERGLEKDFEKVCVVWVPRAVQIERLIARDNMTSAEAIKRLGAQGPLDDKRVRADLVIDNSGSLEETRQQVAVLLQAAG